MNNKILGGAVLLVAAFSLNEVRAQTCEVPPTCAQLGYTMKKADCGENPALRCPFALTDDNQVYCGQEASITVGAILYGDGTVTKEILSGTNAPTPIGIVFDEENRLAVALTDVKQDGSAGSEGMYWSTSYYDVPNLENCTSDSTVISCGTDGRTNTDAILACGGNCGGTPAASACNGYQPVGCAKDFCKQKKWFLPSMRDLNNIYLQKAQINETLFYLEKEPLTEAHYWSSNEKDYDLAWNMGISGGFRFSNGKYFNTTVHVRPVVAY